MKRLLVIFALVFTTGCMGPPFYGESNLGFTYRSRSLNQQNPNCARYAEYYGDCIYHPYPAVDFRLPQGKLLRAVKKGTIIKIGNGPTLGAIDETGWRDPDKYLVLRIDRPEGDCRDIAYKHLSTTIVSVGDRVARGQPIARNGGDHLHFDCHDLDSHPFNSFAGQRDYGIIEWCHNGHRIGGSGTFEQGMTVKFNDDGMNCR